MKQSLCFVCFLFATWLDLSDTSLYLPCRYGRKGYAHGQLVLERSSRCQHCYCINGEMPCISTDCSQMFPTSKNCYDSDGIVFVHGYLLDKSLSCYCIDGVEYCVVGSLLKRKYNEPANE